MISIIIIAFGIFSAIGAFIAAASKIYDPSKKGINKITYPGAFFILCAVVLVLLPAFQNWFTENAQKKDQDDRDKKLKTEYDNSLRSMKSEFDKSSKASTSLVTETLGKYGYKFDSLNKVLVNIRDSTKTRVIIETESPVFGICNEPCKGIELIDSSSNSYKFRISCISEDAGSSHFKLKSSIVTEDADGRIFIARKQEDGFVQPTMKLSKNSIVSINTTIFTPIKIAKIYFWITGSYKKVDGTGYYPVDEIYTYALREKFTKVVVSPSLRQRIIDLVEKN